MTPNISTISVSKFYMLYDEYERNISACKWWQFRTRSRLKKELKLIKMYLVSEAVDSSIRQIGEGILNQIVGAAEKKCNCNYDCNYDAKAHSEHY